MSELKLPAASGGGSISIKGPASSGSDTDLLDTSGNLNITGQLTCGSHLNLGDGDEIKVGAGEDLLIYHTSDQNYLKSNNGRINLRASEVRCENAAGTEVLAKFIADGACELRYNDSAKLTTIDTGVNITGGIRLGGNNAANELDDYENGDWTATFEGHNTAGSFSFGSGYGTGKYTKIGNLVTFTIYTGNMTISGTDGVAKITGLPFTSAAGNRLHNMFSVTHATCFDHNCSGGYVNPGATYGYFMRGFDTTSSNSWAGGGYLMISGTYQTD